MNNITITDKAAEYIKNVISDNDFENCYLELDAFRGGCSGYEYRLGLIDMDEPDISDIIIEHNGINILVSGRAMKLVDGSVIDLVENGATLGFKIENPNETKSCGCGKSFSTGEEVESYGCNSCNYR